MLRVIRASGLWHSLPNFLASTMRVADREIAFAYSVHPGRMFPWQGALASGGREISHEGLRALGEARGVGGSLKYCVFLSCFRFCNN